MNWSDLSEVLKKTRNDRNMTQEELAEKAAVSIASVQRVEAGKKIAIKTLFGIFDTLKPFDSYDDFTVNDVYELYKN